MPGNTELKERVKILEKENEDIKNPEVKITKKDGLYYKEDGESPFCTACYDNKKKLIGVVKIPETFKFAGKYKCPNCKTYYQG